MPDGVKECYIWNLIAQIYFEMHISRLNRGYLYLLKQPLSAQRPHSVMVKELHGMSKAIELHTCSICELGNCGSDFKRQLDITHFQAS